jgi:hypothetical protein
VDGKPTIIKLNYPHKHRHERNGPWYGKNHDGSPE